MAGQGRQDGAGQDDQSPEADGRLAKRAGGGFTQQQGQPRAAPDLVLDAVV